jgi:hypothetical protein
MRYCFDHRAEAAALGEKGRAEVEQKLSLKAAGQRMADQLAHVSAFAETGIRPERTIPQPVLRVLSR